MSPPCPQPQVIIREQKEFWSNSCRPWTSVAEWNLKKMQRQRWILLVIFIFGSGDILTNVLSCGTEEENVGFNDLGYVSRSSLHRSRKKRDVSISDRKACDGSAQPLTRWYTLHKCTCSVTHVSLSLTTNSIYNRWPISQSCRRFWLNQPFSSTNYLVV